MRTPGEQVLVEDWHRIWEAGPPGGWDFSHLPGLTGQDPPWDFDALSGEALAASRRAVDLGTGGGEQLLRLREHWPPDLQATEGWPPNLPVARALLEPHGVIVHDHDADAEPAVPLPFGDASLDLVLNRHEAYRAADVARVLAPGGQLLTQQVDGHDLPELLEWFGGETAYPDVTLPGLSAAAEAAGLRVRESAAWQGRLLVADVDTLVGYLAMTPWSVPADFSPRAHAAVLLRLHRRLLDEAGASSGTAALILTQHRFWFRAVRRAG